MPAPEASAAPLNIMSVDVEDYHDQLALDFQDRIVPPDAEAVRCTERMLELFAEYGVKVTCFILGEGAEHFPALVRRIADDGHHLGIHGYHHHQVYRLRPDEFRSSVGEAKKLVEDVAGREANAYRATAFSINEKSGTTWAMDILAELGFRYDSSVFPFAGRRYGSPNAPRQPYHHMTSHGPLWEIPLSTIVHAGRRLPVCGGGYLRHFPLWWTDRAVRRLNAEGLGAVVYLHPYEVETRPHIQPLKGLTWKQWAHFHFFNFEQVRRRATTIPKLRHLMSRYRFGTIEQAVSELESSGYQPPQWSFGANRPACTTTPV